MSSFPHLSGSVAQTQVIMSADVLVELAKNAANPVKCDWGAGTKMECNVLLGSWTLLKKHLCTLHCRTTKNDFFCQLPRCNCQLHSSHLALAEHVDSVHLSRLTFSCPLSGCKGSPLKGTEALVKHYQEHHRDMDGQVLEFPVDYMTWKPFPWPWMISQGALDIPPPPLPSQIGPGRILVNVSAQLAQNTLNLEAMTLGEEAPTPSQEPRLSQELGITPSQGIHPMTRRRRTKHKQLEKPEKKVVRKWDAEEDDGVPSVTLDDLTKFGSQSDLADLNCHNGDTSSGKGVLRGIGGREDRVQDVTDTVLKKKADTNVIFAQKSKLCLVDLSRPQPMLMTGVGLDGSISGKSTGSGKLGVMGMPKSILFEALMRKVDEMERTGMDAW